MIKYLSAINKINDITSEYNFMINFKIDLLDTKELDNDSYFMKTKNKEWKDVIFPRNCEVGGVYFYFGTSKITNKIHIYIGKASYSSTIGQRLFKHFRVCYNINNLNKISRNGEEIEIELVSCIPFELKTQLFFATSLEEYLLSKFSEDNNYELINTIR